MTGSNDKVDLDKTIRNWIKANPTANPFSAHETIGATLLGLMRASQRKHPDWYPAQPEEFSYFVCVGYYMGLQEVYVTLYRATTTEITSTPDHPVISPGHFRTFGWSRVCAEITSGKTTKQLEKFESDPTIGKYKRAIASKSSSTITEADLLTISRICLEATESPEGREVEPQAGEVGQPNRYAVIDDRNGFRWVNAP